MFMITKNINSTESEHPIIGMSFEHSLMDGAFIFNNMKKICGIYKIVSPSKKIYIGQSINIYERWKTYKRLNCKMQTLLFRSFKKYSIEKHKFEIVQQCEREKLDELEKYYIQLFQCYNSKYGLNLKEGGHNSALSDITKKKISEGNKGKLKNRPFTEEHKRKISESHKGIIPYNKGCKISEETKKKISETHKGMKCSEETKQKISKAKKGKKNSDEQNKKISEVQKGRPAHNKGLKWTEGTILKMSKYHKENPAYNKWKKFNKITRRYE